MSTIRAAPTPRHFAAVSILAPLPLPPHPSPPPPLAAPPLFPPPPPPPPRPPPPGPRAGVARRPDLDVSGTPCGARAPRQRHDDPDGPPRGLHVGAAPHRGCLGRVRPVRRGGALLAAGVHDRRIEHQRLERSTLRPRVRPTPPTLLLLVGGGKHVAVPDVPGHVRISSAPAHGGHDPRRSVRCVPRGAGERTGHPLPPHVDVGGRDRQGPPVLLRRPGAGPERLGGQRAGGEAGRRRDHVAPGQAGLLTGVPCAGGSGRLRRHGRRGRARGPKAEASSISTARSSLIDNLGRDLSVSEPSIVLLVGRME